MAFSAYSVFECLQQLIIGGSYSLGLPITSWTIQDISWLLIYHDLWGSCCCSVSQSCPTLCNPMDCSTPGFPVLQYSPEFAQTHVHWLGDAIQPSQPLSPPSPLAFNLPSIRVFSSELALCIRWPKYWSFSFSISPSSEYSGLISFRIDWLDLLTVQETLWLNGREHICQSRRHGFDLWLGKIPWRRTWQSTPVFLPGKSCGQRSLVGYSPWGSKRVGHNLMTKQQKQQAFPLFTLLYITEMCF